MKPSARFSALPDFKSYAEAAKELRETIVSELQSPLKEEQREGFYPFGAAIGLLLDQTDPQWKRRYLQQKFALEKYSARL